VEFGSCEEILLEMQWSVAGHLHEQRDTVRVVEEDTGKGIDPITVGGGNAITRELGYVRRMHTRDSSTFDWEIGGPVSNYPVDRTPAQISDRGNDRRPR